MRAVVRRPAGARLGIHPKDGKPMASIPKERSPEEVTLVEAVALLAAKAAKV